MPQDSRTTWQPPEELRAWLEQISERVTDFSPVMQVIALDMEDFIENVVFPTKGEGEWQDLDPDTLRRHYANRSSPGMLQLSGDLRRRNSRDWSGRNAVVVNRSPHGHFAQAGTVRRQRALWQSKKSGMKRRSEAQVRKLRGTEEYKGSEHEPPRMFHYVSESRAEGLYGPMILDFVLSEI